MALLEQVLSSDGTQLPEPMLVEWTLGLTLQLIGQEDWERSKRLRELLHRYLNSPSLPADAATPNASKLFALIGELDQASYLPPEVRAELARGFVAGSWDRLTGVLATASRQLGPTSFERKLDRLRLESPALSAVVHAHRIQTVAPSGGGSGWWRLVAVMAVLSGSRMIFSECDSSSPPSVTFHQPSTLRLEQLNIDPKLARTLTLQAEVAILCNEHGERKLCLTLPSFLNRLSREESCPVLVKELQELRVAAGALALSEERQLDRIAAALPELCKP
jgi:hypothetical protein